VRIEAGGAAEHLVLMGDRDGRAASYSLIKINKGLGE
jgi:hypothetical protein